MMSHAPRCRGSWPPTRSVWSSRDRRATGWGRPRVVVHEQHRRRRQLERALHHLALMDRGVVDGALLLHLVGDDLVAFVEEQYTKLLLGLEAHRGAAIVEHLAPGGEHRPLLAPRRVQV